MKIENARHTNPERNNISALVDGVEMSIPVAPGNRHYDALLDAGIAIAPYVAPDPRLTSSTTRRKFCIALAQAGILTKQDAIAAAKGDWPSSMAAVLDTMTADEAAAAQITWAAVQQIDRLDPLILAMQQFIGLTDEQVDGLFA